MKFPVFLIVYNLLTPLQQMVKDIWRMGGIPILIDNQSTYPPLLDWVNEVKDRDDLIYHRMEKNYGPRIVHTMASDKYSPDWQKIQEVYKEKSGEELKRNFVFISDSDLDLSAIPDDGLQVLYKIAQTNMNSLGRRYKKIGFSLRIDDLPDTEAGRYTKQWESHFYQTKRQVAGYYAYEALLDTTFQIYMPQLRFTGTFFGPALRLAEPYIARHIPWYWTEESLNDEIRYYLSHLEHLDVVCHSRMLKQKFSL